MDEGTEVYADQSQVGSRLGFFAVCQQIVYSLLVVCLKWIGIGLGLALASSLSSKRLCIFGLHDAIHI